MSKYISVTDTAKLVRAALKQAFPNTKFSVKSKSYSGGASIDVRWTDGQTSAEVDKVIKRFEGATFDGMVDLKSYTDAVLDGEQVHFGADFVFGQRDFSISFIMRCATITCAYFDVPVPTMNRYNWFDYSDIHPMNGRDTLVDLIRKVMSVTNADDETLNGGWGRVDNWIEAIWLAAKNSSDTVEPSPEPIDAAPAAVIEDDEAWQWAHVEAYEVKSTPADEQAKVAFAEFQRGYAEAEAEEVIDETPCVKVSAETLQPISKPDALRERLTAINADSLSPLEALTLIYELKRLA